jgi:hypothetical protein
MSNILSLVKMITDPFFLGNANSNTKVVSNTSIGTFNVENESSQLTILLNYESMLILVSLTHIDILLIVLSPKIVSGLLTYVSE